MLSAIFKCLVDVAKMPVFLCKSAYKFNFNMVSYSPINMSFYSYVSHLRLKQGNITM